MFYGMSKVDWREGERGRDILVSNCVNPFIGGRESLCYLVGLNRIKHVCSLFTPQ